MIKYLSELVNNSLGEKIVELDINPIICNSKGAFIVDALITEKKL